MRQGITFQHIKSSLAALLISVLMIACATTPPSTPASMSIGPYSDFSGRLIIIEPKHRWQVMIQWKGGKDQGSIRLTHAASGRIVELQWLQKKMKIRDNHSNSSAWKGINRYQLSQYGIVLPPQVLAQILNGNIPLAFTSKDAQTWQGHFDGNFIRIHWSAKLKRLTITDIAHGRKATLIIHD